MLSHLLRQSDSSDHVRQSGHWNVGIEKREVLVLSLPGIAQRQAPLLMPSPIVFLNRFYAPDHSATAQILTDLATDLAAAGRDVTVIASRALYGETYGLLPSRETIAGVKVIRVATPARRGGMVGRLAAYAAYLICASVAAFRLARRGTILIPKTDPPLLSVPVGMIARWRNASMILWLQDLYPEIAVAYGIRIARGIIGRTLMTLRNRSLHNALRVVAIGDLMAERIADAGVERSRILVIPNWTNDAAIIPNRGRSPELRAQWDIPADAFVLAYSGNLGRAHEYDTLLDAAARLASRNDIVFLMIGGGHMASRLANAVAARQLDSFRFVPYQPRERLVDSLSVGDAHWVSLRPEFEGLIVPSKVFGVCAVGRAVVAICAPDGELARLILPAQAGVVVSPGNGAALAAALVSLAANPVTTARMGMAARALLDSRYTRAHALERWVRLLDSLERDTGPSPPPGR